MRVLLAVAWYFPDAVGGTEQYVRALARHLQARGADVLIAVPSAGLTRPPRYDVDGVPVRRFAVDEKSDPRLSVRRHAPQAWRALLDEFRPDVVDLHSLTPDLGLGHLRAARDAGARTVSTLHLPGLICARGTLMRFGESPCDGDLSTQPCTACRLQGQGLPAVVGRALSLVPREIGRGVSRAPVPRAFQRPFTATLAHEERVALVRGLAEASDVVVALSDWQAGMLLRNGVPAERLAVCRQGVGVDVGHAPRRTRRESDPVRVGFVGRYEESKGVHVLVDAVLRLLMGPAGSVGPGAMRAPRVDGAPASQDTRSNLELHLWGVARTAEARAYRDAIRLQCEGVPSISMHEEAAPASIYPNLDVLAVPSIAFETGPLVVLEAQAAGLPVVGSNLGGIAERVAHGVNGLLVPPGDPLALSSALRSLLVDPGQLERLRPVAPVRTMREVADETIERYGHILDEVSA